MTNAPATHYASLNDVAARHAAFAPGERCAIWYMKPEHFTYFMLGTTISGVAEMDAEAGSRLPLNAEALSRTHVCLGTIAGMHATVPAMLEDIYVFMQAENWSPAGEAQSLLAQRGLSHTSMSCGDVIVEGGVIWMVDTCGFTAVGYL